MTNTRYRVIREIEACFRNIDQDPLPEPDEWDRKRNGAWLSPGFTRQELAFARRETMTSVAESRLELASAFAEALMKAQRTIPYKG